MKIVVCYKNVPEEQDISVKPDQTLDLSKASWKIGQYDLNAIEAGAALAASTPNSELIVLTAGGEIVDNSKLKKGVLSRGADRMVGVQDDALATAGAYATAQALKAAVEKLGGVDLVLFGEGSGDIYAQQTGSVTGALLGWPTVNAVQEINPQGGKLALSRGVEDGIELLEVSLPAVLSVTSDINIPRIPSMKDILAAGKKSAEIWTLADIGAKAEAVTNVISILAPKEADRKQIILEGDDADSVEAFYQYLRKIL